MLYTILLIISLCVFLYILHDVRKNKMNIKYAMVWILWSLSIIIISIFPQIVSWLSVILGIQFPSNTVFLIFIFLLYCLSYYIYLMLSKHNEDIMNLNYQIAALKKRIDDLEKKNE